MNRKTTCPRCGKAPLVTRTSKRVGTLIEQRRECKLRKKNQCDYQDRAMIRPSEIISVKMLCAQQLDNRKQAN